MPETTDTDPVAAYLAEVREREGKAIRGPWVTEYDHCDCGDGYGCGHGSWVCALRLPEPRHEEFADGRQIPVSDYHYSYSELSEFPDDTAEFIAAARTAVPRLRAAVEAVLALAQAWSAGAADLDARADKATAIALSALLSARAQALTDCATALRETIAGELPGGTDA